MDLTKDLILMLLAVACIAGVLAYEKIQKLTEETTQLEHQIQGLESDIQTLTNELNRTYTTTVVPFHVNTSVSLFNATSNFPFYVNCTFSIRPGGSIFFSSVLGAFELKPPTPVTCVGWNTCTAYTAQYFSPGSYRIRASSTTSYPPFLITGSCSLYGFDINVVRLINSDEINE